MPNFNFKAQAHTNSHRTSIQAFDEVKPSIAASYFALEPSGSACAKQALKIVSTLQTAGRTQKNTFHTSFNMAQEMTTFETGGALWILSLVDPRAFLESCAVEFGNEIALNCTASASPCSGALLYSQISSKWSLANRGNAFLEPTAHFRILVTLNTQKALLH
eukprot:s779_g2.t1